MYDKFIKYRALLIIMVTVSNEIAKITTFALYSNNLKKIDILAKKLSISRSAVMRIMINQYRYEDKDMGELP